MNESNLVRRALNGDIEPTDAYNLLVSDRVDLETLENVAFEISKSWHNAQVMLDGFIGGVLKCYAKPICFFCHRHLLSGDEMSADELTSAMEYLLKKGVKHAELGVGAVQADGGKRLLEILKLCNNNYPEMGVWVKVGYGFDLTYAANLTRIDNIEFVALALEIFDEALHRVLKPGDDLSFKLRLLDHLDKLHLPLGCILVCGLGETLDSYLRLFKLLKFLRNLRYIALCPFTPVATSPLANKPPCEEAFWRRLTCILRIMLPHVEMHSGHSLKALRLALKAGANRFVHFGLSIYHKSVADHLHSHKIGGNMEKLSGNLYVHDLRSFSSKIATDLGLRVTWG